MRLECGTALEHWNWILRNREGEKLPLRIRPGEDFTIGRGQDADLPILDAGISRHHARFFLDETGLWIEDLESQNGTFLNGERVRRSQVRTGDIVTFGRIPLAVLEIEPYASSGEPDAARLFKGLPLDRLHFLLNSAFRLADALDRSTLYQFVLDLAVAEFHADRGVILVPDRGRLEPAAFHPHEGFRDLAQVMSRATCESIFQSRTGRLLRGSEASPDRIEGGSSTGLLASGICAPLLGSGSPLGVIFLESALHRPFGRSDLDCLSAFSALAARSLEAARKLVDARAACEDQRRRCLRQESELEKVRSKLQETGWRPSSGRLVSACIVRLAEAVRGLKEGTGGLPGNAAALEMLASGLLHLTKDGRRSRPAIVLARKAEEEASSDLDMASRDRIRFSHTDPPIAVETLSPDALRHCLRAMLEIALQGSLPAEESAGRGPEVFIKVSREGERILFTCEVPAGDSADSAPSRPVGTAADPLEIEFLRLIAGETLEGDFLVSSGGPVRIYQLRIPARPPQAPGAEETAVIGPEER